MRKVAAKTSELETCTKTAIRISFSFLINNSMKNRGGAEKKERDLC